MADPNHVVLHDYELVVFGPCKIANTSIRVAMAEAFGKPAATAQMQDTWPHKSPKYIAAFCADYLKIGFCRDPYDRFLSAYADQLVNRGRWSRLGLDPGASIEEVAEVVHQIGDTLIDQHWRSQSAEQVWDGKLLPDVLVRFETLDIDWGGACDMIATRCGVRLPSLGQFNGTSDKPAMTARAMWLIAERYGEDFERFGYPI